MGAGWRLTKGAFSAGAATSRVIGDSVAQRAAQNHANRGWRGASRGLIGPFDATPPPHASGYLDYSGLAMPNDLKTEPWCFPVGRYVTPRKKWQAGDRDQLGLSEDVAQKHAVVYAPTQSGKTTSIVAPWIYHAMRAGYLTAAGTSFTSSRRHIVYAAGF